MSRFSKFIIFQTAIFFCLIVFNFKISLDDWLAILICCAILPNVFISLYIYFAKLILKDEFYKFVCGDENTLNNLYSIYRKTEYYKRLHIKEKKLLDMFIFLYHELDLQSSKNCPFGDFRFYAGDWKKIEKENNIKLQNFNNQLNTVFQDIYKIEQDEY